ncbi:MAG: carbohydrate ABC transporter substrate-binding protein [Clostridia bacterium]|nr:carbohydrate ABC transporter substrate-binding protein [Clostridia bacterium]
MKKLIAMLLAAALLAGMAPAALASVGDATIYYAAPEYGMGYYSVDNCVLVGGKVFYSTGDKFYVYDIAAQKTEEYDGSAVFAMEDVAETEEVDVSEEDEDGASGQSMEYSAWFAYEDALYAVVNLSRYSDTGRTMDGGYIYRLELADGKASLVPSELGKLDWSGMIEDYGGYMYSRWTQNGFAADGSLFLQTSDDDGNGMIEVFDLATGRAAEHYVQDLNSMAPADGGRVLVLQYNWSEDAAHVGFYDPASESLEIRADYPIDQENYEIPTNLCYRPETDTLYYVLSGEIWAAPGFDFDSAAAVNDCPVNGSNGVTQMTEDGFLLLYDWETIVLRNTDPAQRSEITLYVKDFGYNDVLDQAYYDFTNRRGDVSMVISRTGNPADILQAMMNRDGGVDIYCMDMSLSQYSAVFERGYMAELDASAYLTEKIDSMYPAISEAVKKNGSLYAVPLNAYGYAMGVSTDAMEKLGLTMDDMPKTWDGFFDFLAELPEKLEGSQEVRAFYSWNDRRDLRMQLFSTILMSYQNYINGGEVQYAFNTPLLKNLLARLDEIDFAALDVNETNYDEETDTWYDNYDGRNPLFVDGVSIVMQSYNEGEPLLLCFGDEPPKAAFNLRVAFVNPFSRHVPECIEYLETVLEHLNQQAQYTFYPDCDEPIRFPDFEEYKANLAQWLEEARQSLAEADEDEKEDYEEWVKALEEDLNNIDDTYWMFSPKNIEAYKARAPYLSPVTYDFTNDMTSDEGDNFYDLIQRYYDGMIDVDELLTAIDKKVQMMRLEGM